MKEKTNISDLTPQQRLDLARGTKAAPVGEREAFDAWAASVGYHTERDMFQREKYQSTLTWELWRVWQAGAAYQRAQQPQSAEAVAVVKESQYLLGDTSDEISELLPIGTKLYSAPQPSAGVVMPERNIKQLASVLYQACGAYDMPERVLDLLSAAANGEDFEHLIDGVLPCCPQTNAGTRIPERKERPYGFTHMPSHYEGWNACLDEFARLNGKEVGRG